MSETKMARSLTRMVSAALAASACAGSEPAPAEYAGKPCAWHKDKRFCAEKAYNEEAIRDAPVEQENRACRSDAFFIEVPFESRPFWKDNEVLIPKVTEALRKRLLNHESFFFQTSPGILRVEMNPVLRKVAPGPGVPDRRVDGHLRFYRVRFVDGITEKVLRLDEEAECAMLSAIRTDFLVAATGVQSKWLHRIALSDAVEGAVGEPEQALWKTVYVGRECDGLAADWPHQAPPNGPIEPLTRGHEDWHLRALGVSHRVQTPSKVDVALVDSGIIAPMNQHAAVSHAADRVRPALAAASSGMLSPHGTSMAKLIHQVAPGARIRSCRVLDGQGFATSEALARCLDDMVLEAAAVKRPRVINLSLGWPPEKSEFSREQGPFPVKPGHSASEGSDAECKFEEGPLGESVKYVLAMAQEVERAGTPVTVVSAVGNRLRLRARSDDHAGTCRNHWFYPGNWMVSEDCETPGRFFPLSWGVGGIDARGYASSNAVRWPEPPLVAPAQHVAVENDGEPRRDRKAPSSPPNNPTGAAPVPDHQYERFVSGTSASAALVSGLVAHAQALQQRSGRAALSTNELFDLIYLTGITCERPGQRPPEGVGPWEVRLPSFENVSFALTEGWSQCKELLDCVGTGRPPWDASVSKRCSAALDGCPLPRSSRDPSVTCPRPDGAAWIAPHQLETDPNAAKSSGKGPLRSVDPIRMFAPASVPDQWSTGSIGPAPMPMCCVCGIEPGIPGVDSWDALFELRPDLLGNLSQPAILAEDLASGEMCMHPLPDAPAVQWYPGAHIMHSFQTSDWIHMGGLPVCDPRSFSEPQYTLQITITVNGESAVATDAMDSL